MSLTFTLTSDHAIAWLHDMCDVPWFAASELIAQLSVNPLHAPTGVHFATLKRVSIDTVSVTHHTSPCAGDVTVDRSTGQLRFTRELSEVTS